MPKDAREPQSYGSNVDWVTGKTGETVNDPKSPPPPEHREFYDDSRDSEASAPHQGGEPSPLQVAESEEPEGRATERDKQPVTNVTSRFGGAKRSSYFKKRDYE